MKISLENIKQKYKFFKKSTQTTKQQTTNRADVLEPQQASGKKFPNLTTRCKHIAASIKTNSSTIKKSALNWVQDRSLHVLAKKEETKSKKLSNAKEIKTKFDFNQLFDEIIKSQAQEIGIGLNPEQKEELIFCILENMPINLQEKILKAKDSKPVMQIFKSQFKKMKKFVNDKLQDFSDIYTLQYNKAYRSRINLSARETAEKVYSKLDSKTKISFKLQIKEQTEKVEQIINEKNNLVWLRKKDVNDRENNSMPPILEGTVFTPEDIEEIIKLIFVEMGLNHPDSSFPGGIPKELLILRLSDESIAASLGKKMESIQPITNKVVKNWITSSK